MITYPAISKENTLPTLKLALGKAMQIGAPVVIATTGGECATLMNELAKEAGYDGELVVVTHCWGFRADGTQEVPDSVQRELEADGRAIVTAAHALSGVERNFGSGVEGPATLIAQSLRMFCAGVKVCVEISAMALDAGKVPFGKRVVAVAGTGRGADTAVVLTPNYTAKVLKTKIHEMLCMPE